MITTENTTTENNQIIAKFMGMVYDNHDNQPNKYWELTDDQNFVSQEAYLQDKDLKFHSDWNWLMEVVEKIESLGFKFQITSQYAAVLKNHSLISQSLICTVDGIYKIQATHETVAAFIKWYKILN